jgi:ABC-type antimicrobial peptide transport system permease subunit
VGSGRFDESASGIPDSQLADFYERVREAVWLAGAGAVAGVLAALVGVRVIRSYLYGVAPHDPSSLIAAVALLGATAVIAAWLPARRAARVEPMRALRCE